MRQLLGGRRLVFRVQRIQDVVGIAIHPRPQRRMIEALDGGAGGRRSLRQAPRQGRNHDIVRHGAGAAWRLGSLGFLG
ncbi:hypothetical protein D3C81_1843570 [compost metagenome]